MSTSIEAKIIDGLLRRFGTISLPAGTTVAYPNISFTPDGVNPYVKLTVAKNDPTNPRIRFGNEPIRQGIFLAVVGWSIGGGPIVPTELAATIRAKFARGSRFTEDGVTITIMDEPAVRDGITAAPYYEVPVVIPWTVYP